MEEMAEAARHVKKNAGIDGIVARGTPAVATVATGFISGIKSYTDGKWNELDDKLNPTLHDPRIGEVHRDVGGHGARRAARRTGPT